MHRFHHFHHLGLSDSETLLLFLAFAVLALALASRRGSGGRRKGD